MKLKSFFLLIFYFNPEGSDFSVFVHVSTDNINKESSEAKFMDTRKPSFEKETNPLKTRAERLPIIEERKVKKGNTSKKSANTLLKPKLNFPKLKPDEISHQRADAGEPGGFDSKVFIQQTNPLLDSSISGLVLDVENVKQSHFQNGPKVIGISECKVGFKVPSSELITEDFETEEENLEESNALKRWKFWLRDKIHTQNVLSKKLGRNPCDLQIQESDKYRAIFEDKLLLTYSQIPKRDKWRGHPFFWKQKLSIGPRKVPDDSEIPHYFAAETKVGKGEIPEIEFIGVPEVVRKEKGCICTSENSALKNWEKMPYRQEQISRFKDQRKKMKPHNLSMDELAIVGVKVTKEQEETKEFIKPQNAPEILITEENSESLQYRESIFCLAINDEEIKYELGTENCQDPDKVFIWQIDFGVNKIESLVEKVLRIENRGTVAVAYDWNSSKNHQKQSLDLPQPKLHEPWFFFNKNSGLFLPGQIYELKFYHFSKISGVRKEVWYLKTKPPLKKNQESGTIVLSAVATEEFSYEKDAVEYFLRKRMSDTVVRFALEVIFYKVFNPSENLREIEYRSLFQEKELFEYHNSKHYYHSSILKELKELFDEIPLKSQNQWDFSLNSLVALVKTSNKGREKNSLLHKIAKNSQKLFRPNYLNVKKVKKHRMTYEILCKMVTLIEDDYNSIRNLLSQKKEEDPSRSSFKTKETSKEEFNEATVEFEKKPVNFIYFQTMFNLKVYQRLGEAIESMVGMIETNKLFESWKQGPELVKPSRRH